MTRLAGEPPEDDMFRTSIALRPSWARRLKEILARRDVTFAEMVRRWITQEEWIARYVTAANAEPLYVQRKDGSYERVRLWSA